ncbi:hypothetical protein [Chryseobacterium indoltheticum]|uniref:hypothetical protein n=1 Tax=Chryseobacterium indoltheticum TaxID=254 RepID=UPI0019126C30|nr:hypothetical protein [Chryseobacterium indoltheticum]QQQ28357.1 hypothetical protein JJL46_20200 [Chryseobacterium indoltheticum]
MKHLHKILALSFLLGYSIVYAQLDTLNYLKQFESGYNGQTFSKLYKSLKIKPNAFAHTTSIYFSSTTFFYQGKIELRIEWSDSPYSTENQCLKAMKCYKASKCIFTKKIANTFDKFKIKNITVVSTDQYFMPGCIGQLKPVKDINQFFRNKLSGILPMRKDISFGDFFFTIRPLQPIRVKNITDTQTKNRVSTSYITFAFEDKHISKQ